MFNRCEFLAGGAVYRRDLNEPAVGSSHPVRFDSDVARLDHTSAMKTSAPLANLITFGARDFSSLRDFYRNLGWPQIIDDGHRVDVPSGQQFEMGSTGATGCYAVSCSGRFSQLGSALTTSPAAGGVSRQFKPAPGRDVLHG